MGSRGGGSYLSSKDLEKLQVEARKRLEQSRFNADVNSFLQHELADFNDRDSDAINRHLERIEVALEGSLDSMDRLLFGGSVAKQTYVDGLSDVDSLVVLTDETLADKTPDVVMVEFETALRSRLPQGEVRDIQIGQMAVTVNFRDGTEIQLLPAVQKEGSVLISSADGKAWSQINPKAFARDLSRVNQRQGGSVVPAIKLAKAILANQLSDKAPSGYHLEALAISAFTDYTGPRTPKAMVSQLFVRAASDVLRPIQDVTGQSHYVDEYLGGADSPARRELARSIQQLGKMMSESRSTADWRSLFE